jgi:NAD+ synthase (glutamine-hydrolysing)
MADPSPNSYLRLLGEWKDIPVRETAEITKRFYKFYAINRHKSVIATPAIHLSG